MISFDEQIAQMSNPVEFVRLCNALLTAEYKYDFQIVDGTRGDEGNDGYIAADKCLIAIYCPMKPERRTDGDYIAKIKSDLAKIPSLQETGAYPIRRWAFVTPRKLSNKVLSVMRAEAKRAGIDAVQFESTYLANLLLKHKHLVPEFPALQTTDIDGKLTKILSSIELLKTVDHPSETRVNVYKPETVDTSSWVHRPGAWPQFLEIDQDYRDLRKQLLHSISNKQYELANSQYHQILHYMGTRELWDDADFFSKQILDLSNQHKDYKNFGIIFIKGRAWQLLRRRRFNLAEDALEKAFDFLKSRSEKGLFYDRIGDLYFEKGRVALANEFYTKARDHLRDVDAHKAELKRLFLKAQNINLDSSKRIDELTRLWGEFRSIKSYREGMVLIELAKSYHFLHAPEAISVADGAYKFLCNEVKMPSMTAKAEQILKFVKQGKPFKGRN